MTKIPASLKPVPPEKGSDEELALWIKHQSAETLRTILGKPGSANRRLVDEALARTSKPKQ